MALSTKFRRPASLLFAAFALAGSGSSPAGGFADGFRELGKAIGDGAAQVTRGVETGVRANLTGENIVVGTVEIASPVNGWLTCFRDLPGGVASTAPISSPSQGVGFPAMIMTRQGVVTSGACAELERQGLLRPPAGTATLPGAAVPPKTPCSAIPPESQAKYARNCVSFDPADQCASLPADGTFGRGGADLAALCDARRVNAMAAKEYFPARPAAAAVAPGVAAFAAPPAVNGDDVAATGAQRCHLSTADMTILRDTAVRFVRFDRATDKVIVSEVVNGSRQNVALDAQAFAQRSMQVAQDLAAGGNVCGRAVWNAEAYKAATAEMSRPL